METQNVKSDSLKETIEIENYGKKNQLPPKSTSYLIRIDKTKYIVETELITGRELLTLANKIPVTNYRLDQKLHGGAAKKIELNDIVDLLSPGIERFMTLPLDQTEG
ncbi:MAG: multiubiquitin domain-containing protein [Bacillota bacterium]|nr:multiubiquitin domain-containing protein [Bacillota bacterium]